MTNAGKCTNENGIFTEIDNIGYQVFEHQQRKKQHRRLPSYALLVPKSLVATVLVNTHLELLHPGWDKTMNVLKPWVYWKTMCKDMDRLVRDCEPCCIKTLCPLPLQNLGVDPPHKPMMRLVVDLWTYEFGTALTAMDLYSQYPFIIFIKDKTSEEAARALSGILVGIATQQEILSDNGKEFTGKEFQEVLSKRQIKHVTTAAYSPQSNRILEWFHRYLGQCIRMSLKCQMVTDKDGWHWKGACLTALEAY